MKKVIALLLVSIVCGCTPQCTGDSKQHNFGNWKHDEYSFRQERQCSICGWTEGKRIEN